MKVKTSELTGSTLDYLVAKCKVGTPTIRVFGHAPGCRVYKNASMQHQGTPFQPSTDWAQGGPIIEAEGIELLCNLTATEAARFACGVHANWQAFYRNSRRTEQRSFASTPLIAAMRCYVARKLGAEVDVPDELVKH